MVMCKRGHRVITIFNDISANSRISVCFGSVLIDFFFLYGLYFIVSFYAQNRFIEHLTLRILPCWIFLYFFIFS